MLIEKKGYADLVAACGLLRDAGIAFRCRIVGEGPLEAALQAQIEALGLQGSVALAGPLPLPEIRRLLAEETQVFALACATESDGGKDNLPTVLMEAMAASLPCVSTRLAGVPEMVLDGVTGLLCEEGEPAALAAHLKTLLGDAALCERLGSAGLAHAERLFTRDATGRELLGCFAELSGLRTDAALRKRQPWLRAKIAGRWLLQGLSRQLRHRVKKVHGKSFDLEAFMG